MAKLLKLRRGTTDQHDTFTGAEGECTVDMTKDVLVIHDGQTQGGHPVAAEDMSNVSSAHIAGRLNNDSIATSKIAAGALPTDVTIDTDNINNDAITFAKMQNIAQNSILARLDSGSGDIQELSAAQIRGIINVENGATGDQTAAEILTAIKTVDGTTSGLDADVLDGQHGSYYQNASNLNAGTINDARLPATISSDITGNAASADTVDIGEANANQNYYPVFTETSGSAKTINIDGGLNITYNPSSNTLTAGTFSGSHSGNGSSLTSLNGSNISSGTIAAARVATLNQNTTGNAASATALETGRNISGVFFNGTQNITLNNSNITNGAGYTTYTSNQGTDTNDNVNFASVTATGNITAFSDATLKTDIHTINEALGIVGKLRGVTYKWLSNGEADIGVIAQEVQEVVPEVIKETVDGIKTVDYGRLVSVLINAVDELNEKLDKHIEGGK